MYILKKIRFKDWLTKDYFELLNHVKNYLTAEFLNKGLAFISIPIFTRLLLPKEYGILSVFTSLISIFSILLSFNIHGSVSRYYYEEKDDFESFIYSNLVFIALTNLLLILSIYIIKDNLASFLDINTNIFMIAIFVSVCTIVMNFYKAYLQASRNSKRYSVISVTTNILILILSIIWMLTLKDNRYFGRIYSVFIVRAVVFVWIIYQLVKISKIDFNIKHIKYSLKFGVPLIPHAMSGFILAYFDRIIINQISGANDTGLYSFAYNVGMIMNIIVMASNRAWVPIFYEKLKNREYNKLQSIAENYSKYIFLAASGLILFSGEIVKILADKKYFAALEIVPIIVLGYVFVFLYTLYGNYSFYKKKTFLISINTLIAGSINVILNYIFIPKYGYIAAAYTTLVSYIILFVLHFNNVKLFLKINPCSTIKFNKLIKYFSIIVISLIIFYGSLFFKISFLISFILKFIFMTIFLYYTLIKNSRFR